MRRVRTADGIICRSAPELDEDGKPIPGIPPIETAPHRCVRRKVRDNRLTVRASLWDRNNVGALIDVWERSADDTKEVKVSQWAAGVPGIDYGYITRVDGICARHAASPGGATRTATGKVSDPVCDSSW